jgi:hypothetical protein
MNEQTRSYNSGKFDGINAASMKNPAHNNWAKDDEGKAVHFDPDYLQGYKDGFYAATGTLPDCLVR